MRAGRLLIPLATLGLLLTSGCTAAGSEPGPSGSPSAGEPFFASEEEAAEAASDLLRDYIDAINDVLASGGSHSGQLNGVATSSLIAQQEVGFAEYETGGLKLIGSTTVDSFELQQYAPLAAEEAPVVIAYFCRDVSATDVVDSEGDSVVPADRQARLAFEASFVINGDDRELRISKDEQWQNDNFCS